MNRPHLSYSALKAFGKSPNHFLQYEAAKINGGEPSPAMLLGSLTHCMVLEPGEVLKRYAKSPQIDRRTKAGKESWADFITECLISDRTSIKAEEWDKAEAITGSVLSSPEYADLFSKCESERQINAKIDGVPFRAFVDLICADYCADLKTCRDASPKAFGRTVANEAYHVQGALYCELSGTRDFYIVAVESAPPYNVQIYQLDEFALEAGREKLAQWASNFLQWDGKPGPYFSGVETISLPPWAV